MGMVVQLAVLALVHRAAPGHYLLASGVAVELAVVHNFVWHQHYTWRERRGDSAVIARLVRFQLSNGLVSMLGNLLLMRVLHGVRVPLLVSNGIAILCCSVVNFCLGDRWAFAGRLSTAP
jgi:putative flippase GtrA